MAARIVQIDLAEPITPIEAPRRYSALWILVRFGRQPLGWIKCRRALYGDVLRPDMLKGLLSETLNLQLIDACRFRQFERAHPTHQLGVSVVICTREHPDLLERQLNSMRSLEYPDFEVIVVDNAPRTKRTEQVCDKFSFVRRVVEPVAGLDYARNTGWRAARKEIVAYTDDDACVDRHWLDELAQPYADPRVQCVMGTTFPLELETEAQEFFEKYGGMQRGFHRRVYRAGTWSAFFPLGSGRFGAGVNMSLRRAALEKMGGFDPALDVGSLGRGGGDLDIMARVIRDGGTLVYEPRAIVWHQHRQTMKELRRQMFDYGWGFCAYVMKHARDLELGNHSMHMLWRWGKKWGVKRLIENVKLAIMRRPHFPIHLIVLEIAGGLMGLRAYRQSIERVKLTAERQRKDDLMRIAA